MHPLSLFSLNCPFLNVINAIKDIKVGIWDGLEGFIKLLILYADFLDINFW